MGKWRQNEIVNPWQTLTMKTEILETAEAQTCTTGMEMQTTWSGHLNIYHSPLLILSVVFSFMHYNSADKSQ